MAVHPLLDVESVDALERHLEQVGRIFRAFREQDSGCVSYGVAVGAERWFVKEGTTVAATASLHRAVAVHATVRHPAVIPLRHVLAAGDGLALVYPWADGEVLYPATASGRIDRAAPGSAMARFRRLPVAEVCRALDRILDAHLAVERAGLVAVDFYDGCLLYDFAAGRMMLCDLDEYRPGPFVLDTDRLPGSRRYMAPEEFRTGATIDTRTTVHALGRALRLLLDAGDQECAWRGSSVQLAVIERATDPEPSRRYPRVADLACAWRAATAPQR